jgi:hypothetical protein
MGKIEDAAARQLANIEAKAGRPLADLVALVNARAEDKHGALVAFCKAELGLGHGDANALVHHARRAADTAPAAVAADPADAWYAGPKAALRPLHDALIARIGTFGAVEAAPKKTYVSLRRAKQFATVGPGPKGQLEVGLNLRGDVPPAGDRLVALPAGGMCTHRVRIASEAGIDDELLRLLRAAWDSSA